MMWFFLFAKRNLKKISFIFILLLIPAVTLALSLMTQKDSGIMRIGYTATGSKTQAVKDIFSNLEQRQAMLIFEEFSSIEEGEFALSQADIDSLWIFPGDLEKRITEYYSNADTPPITVLERSDSETAKLARERLFCTVYPYLSYEMFRMYMTGDSIPDGNSLSEEDLLYYYQYKGIDTDIVQVVTIDSNADADEQKGNFLTTPLRGILSVIVMLSALASAMYALEDTKRGLFVIFSPKKRFLLCVAAILSAVIPASCVAFVALTASGLSEGVLIEIARLAVFDILCTAFALFVMRVFQYPKPLSSAVVLLTLSAAVFSPIFVNINVLPVIQGLFPTYHYLYSLSDGIHMLYMALLAVAYSTISVFICRNN